MTITPNADRLACISLTGRVLGTLFYSAPSSQEAAPLMQMLATTEWADEWPMPFSELPSIAAKMQEGSAGADLDEAWQRLFIGPYALPAAPWGSVWLDKEKVLFGDSTLELRQWMREHNIASIAAQNEPEDHIGLLLLMAAWLAEAGEQQALDELLAWHLLPWADRFLECFTERAGHSFYEALGELTRHTLVRWQRGMILPVSLRELYL